MESAGGWRALARQRARHEVYSPRDMKVGIVGSGMVGSASAFALVMRGVGREIVLVDVNRERAEAEANDIYHAVPFAHPLTVRAGTYADLAGCRAVVIAAGVAQRPGETRLQLLERNAAVLGAVVPSILEHAPHAVLVVVSNPVDIMTHLAAHFAAGRGVPATRVIGSGTMLDTARFRALLGRHFDVDAQHVHAYVLGEHGDSEVLTWSQATIAGMRLEDFVKVHGTPLRPDDRREIDEQVRRAAYRIIAGKGATCYGIGSAVARLLDVILHDQHAVLTICCRIESVPAFAGVTFALPHLVSGRGAVATIAPPLDDVELAALERSASVLREAVGSLQLGRTEGGAR
jgi:L-lactate dehydrogenase